MAHNPCLPLLLEKKQFQLVLLNTSAAEWRVMRVNESNPDPHAPAVSVISRWLLSLRKSLSTGKHVKQNKYKSILKVQRFPPVIDKQ